ncbi:hypothetical protein PILCRDRAFT_667436 [Piloderma croceum F 1598]|uniref:Uncharacterized protein n=1 Tax=Piloderma croceum (strain F 1598) TaxID=765440 RepID=A0A0C3BEI8_PILCF|nr:hypothetical protein PILCRDRAFT_667436 [Piloderma croceum F 1598]
MLWASCGYTMHLTFGSERVRVTWLVSSVSLYSSPCYIRSFRSQLRFGGRHGLFCQSSRILTCFLFIFQVAYLRGIPRFYSNATPFARLSEMKSPRYSLPDRLT